MPDAGTAVAAKPLSLTVLLEDGKMVRDESQRDLAKKMIAEYINQLEEKTVSLSEDVVKSIQARIEAIDGAISDQVNEILHDQEFQRLESSWRGLHYMVMNTETSTRLKLRLLNATKEELTTDLEKAVEFDQSNLFKKVYEEEYGTFGGAPFSCLIGDYYFGRHPKHDIRFLTNLAGVAAAAHAPFIAAADPKLFDMDSFTELGVPRDLAKGFDTLELQEYVAFRKMEDARYVSLVLPRFLLRLPYGPDTEPVDGLLLREDTDGKDHSKYLWGNSAYALGTRITAAFARYGWTAAIRGYEGGGVVERLPMHIFDTGEGDKALKSPTEVAITDRREKELSDLGFISLVHRKGTGEAAFFGGQTANKPKVYNTNDANANARLSAMLPYMLAASRFAHYLKVIMRDKIGSFMTRENVSDYLNTWIAAYVLLDDNASQPVKAKYPLREARVDVVDIPGRPGCYKAVAFLRPHFQLEELTVSIRLVAELPQPAA